MALLEFFDVTLASFDERRLWGFHLDYPVRGSIADAAAIEVRGWVLGRDSPAVAVEILDDERAIRRMPLDVRRDDVALVYPAAVNAHESGFLMTLRMRPGEERELKVQAVLKDQTRLPLAVLRMRTRWSSEEDRQSPLVSVIIPCYRQAPYLAEAIESILAQTYPHVEIVVIDDGSPDNASEIAGRYPGVRCVRQPNRGVSEARNLGIRTSNGGFLIFLDADDRLLPRGIELGLDCFAQHPEVAFVSGHLRLIDAGGATLYEGQGPRVDGDLYAHMLRRNYIPAPCAMMCRRTVFDLLGGFDPTLSVVADYDFYLRILREFPAWSHDADVADYRRHGQGLSANTGELLREALAALRAQRRHVKANPALGPAYRTGLRFWKMYAADLTARRVRVDWRDGRRRSALQGLLQLRRCGWAGLATLTRRGQAGVST